MAAGDGDSGKRERGGGVMDLWRDARGVETVFAWFSPSLFESGENFARFEGRSILNRRIPAASILECRRAVTARVGIDDTRVGVGGVGQLRISVREMFSHNRGDRISIRV